MENVSDRELFCIRNFDPPLLIHMVLPFIDEERLIFPLQINDDAI